MANITFKGEPKNLVGEEVKVGEQAPNFTVLANDLTPKTLDDFTGPKLIVSVPSLDTGVCDAEARRFNEEANNLGNVKVLTISMDLPFAQARWCGANGIENVTTLSDHREASFGKAYGALIEDLRLLARTVFVVNSKNEVTYVEYVSETTNHPNYEAALEAARSVE